MTIIPIKDVEKILEQFRDENIVQEMRIKLGDAGFFTALQAHALKQNWTREETIMAIKGSACLSTFLHFHPEIKL